MQGVLAGFATIAAIIGLGFVLAQFGVLRSDSQRLLTGLVFFVATPALLFQTLSTAPVGQILSSGLVTAALSFIGTITQPLRNPITVGSFLGLLCSLTGGQAPAFATAPVGLIAGMAVPGVLLAYGVSLRLDPHPTDGSGVELAVVCGLKLLVQPLLAYARGGSSASTVARCWRQPWSRPCPQPRTSLSTPHATTAPRLWPVTRSSSRRSCRCLSC